MSELGFWSAFAPRSAQLAALFHSGHQQQVFDAVEEMLEQQGMEYCFDLTADEKTTYLVFSPEGDEQSAREIDTLVSDAPSIVGWTVWGRRQRKSIDDLRAILRHLYDIDVFQCRFGYSSKRNPDRIEVFVPDETDITADEQQGFANTFLWHAIGEKTVMDRKLQAVVRIGTPQGQQTLSLQDLVEIVLESGPHDV